VDGIDMNLKRDQGHDSATDVAGKYNGVQGSVVFEN
jgi:hypothetical protein